MKAFDVIAQTWKNGQRVEDHHFRATAVDEAALRDRLRRCGTRVVSIAAYVPAPAPAPMYIESNQSGLSGCGVHSFYVD